MEHAYRLQEKFLQSRARGLFSHATMNPVDEHFMKWEGGRQAGEQAVFPFISSPYLSFILSCLGAVLHDEGGVPPPAVAHSELVSRRRRRRRSEERSQSSALCARSLLL